MAGARPMWRTMCLKTQTSGHPYQRVGPSPWGRVHHYACEALDVLHSLHPDKRRHGACLARLPQTAITAPQGPLNIQNATTKPVSDIQACSFKYSQRGMISLHTPCNNFEK